MQGACKAKVTSAAASVLLECGTLGAGPLPAGCLATEPAAESAELPGVEKGLIAGRRECEQQRETTTAAAGRPPRSPSMLDGVLTASLPPPTRHNCIWTHAPNTQ
jgi:hypothetical protein